MPNYRYYTSLPLENQQEVLLKGNEHHHLQKVMRQKEGELCELVDGKGHLAQGKIATVEKHQALIKIQSVEKKKLQYHVVLIQALTSPSHLELIVEKGTELGMTQLILFLGDKSSGFFSEKKLERLHLKAISALKQSGRFFLPEIVWVPDLQKVSLDQNVLFFGDVDSSAPPLLLKLPSPVTRSYAFCSGPESGFSENETEYLKEQGALGISLHTNILRTETAPLCFLSLIHQDLRIKSNSPIIN